MAYSGSQKMGLGIPGKEGEGCLTYLKHNIEAGKYHWGM